MSSAPAAPGLRQRGGKKDGTPSPTLQVVPQNTERPSKSKTKGPQKQSEWDYKLAIVVVTVLAFVTRFWKINYPDQVVFDEVHFGKVSIRWMRSTYCQNGT